MTIETPHLRLLPFTPAGLLALIEEPERFEDRFGVVAADGVRDLFVSGEVPQAWLDLLRTSSAADPWTYGFALVHKESLRVIGSGGFKGPPDATGVAEIAYGIVPAYEGQGLATEAARALSDFALGDPRVSTITAHTLPERNASTRVLEKSGFRYVGEVVDPEDGLVWRWERATGPMPTAISEIEEIVDRETRAWETRDVDLLLSVFHRDMVWPWPPHKDAHDPIDWVMPWGRYDAERWRAGWTALFESHALVHNRRETRRIEVTPEGDGAFAVVDVDTLWRDREGKDFHWLGRACKIYTRVGSEWKMIAHTGLLEYPAPARR